eukprot:COSAG02_NODE_6527_length_3518_cov_40.720679_4_plen_592_part_01
MHAIKARMGPHQIVRLCNVFASKLDLEKVDPTSPTPPEAEAEAEPEPEPEPEQGQESEPPPYDPENDHSALDYCYEYTQDVQEKLKSAASTCENWEGAFVLALIAHIRSDSILGDTTLGENLHYQCCSPKGAVYDDNLDRDKYGILRAAVPNEEWAQKQRKNLKKQADAKNSTDGKSIKRKVLLELAEDMELKHVEYGEVISVKRSVLDNFADDRTVEEKEKHQVLSEFTKWFALVSAAPANGRYKIRRDCVSFKGAWMFKNKDRNSSPEDGNNLKILQKGFVFELTDVKVMHQKVVDKKPFGHEGVIRLSVGEYEWIDALDPKTGIPVVEATEDPVTIIKGTSSEESTEGASRESADSEHLKILKTQIEALQFRLEVAERLTMVAADRQQEAAEAALKKQEEMHKRELAVEIEEERSKLRVEKAMLDAEREKVQAVAAETEKLVTVQARLEALEEYRQRQISDIKSFYDTHEDEFERRLQLDRERIRHEQQTHILSLKEHDLQTEHDRRAAQLEEKHLQTEQDLRAELEKRHPDQKLDAWLQKYFQQTHPRLGVHLATDLGIESLQDLDELSSADMQPGGLLDSLQLPPVP